MTRSRLRGRQGAAVAVESESLQAVAVRFQVDLLQIAVDTDMDLVEEAARHCGHADLLRERIDGRVGQ
jgi:hypothetical protein